MTTTATSGHEHRKRKSEDTGTYGKKSAKHENIEIDQSHQAPQMSSADRATQRREAKETRKQRRMQRSGGEMLEEAKGYWEECRKTALSAEERSEPLNKLIEVLTGHFAEALLKNDGSRIVQTVVKYSSKEQRELIAKELSGNYLDLAKNSYAKHIVTKLLQQCPQKRELIVTEFRGHVLRCVKHKHASSVIDTIYSDYCKVIQRNDMMHEFYGPEYVKFKDHQGKSLDDILLTLPEKRVGILKRLRAAVDGVLGKESTALIHHSVVHRLIYDYVRHEEPSVLRTWLPTICDALVEIVHTADGSKAAVLLIAVASAKERKTLIKACRPYMTKLLSQEFAHCVVIAFLAFVDDTVLIEKTFITEILKCTDLVNNKYLRQILLFVFGNGVCSRYFSKEFTDLMSKASLLAAETSKKPSELRHSELALLLAPTISSRLNVKDSIKSNSLSPLLLEMILSGHAMNLRSSMLSILTSASGELLVQVGPRSFLKRLLKRAPLEPLTEQILTALSPLEKLFDHGDAPFALTPALERFESVRQKVSLVLAGMGEKSESAKSMSALVSRINAGVPMRD